MKTLLTALIAGAFSIASGPTFAQEKTSEPTKEELKKAEAKKSQKAEAKIAEANKGEGKKKVKKGGC